MKPKEIATEWLEDRAKTLREAAGRAERAYSPTGEMGRCCRYIAQAYRDAAALLDERAEADRWALDDEGTRARDEGPPCTIEACDEGKAIGLAFGWGKGKRAAIAAVEAVTLDDMREAGMQSDNYHEAMKALFLERVRGTEREDGGDGG